MAARLGGARPTPPIPDHGSRSSGWDTVALGDVSSHRQSYEDQANSRAARPVPSNPPQSKDGRLFTSSPEDSCGWVPSREVEY